MDHQRGAAIAEDGMAVTWSPIHIFVDDTRLRFAISVDGEVWHIAGMMTFGILQAVLLVVRIEMRAGRFEIWRVTLWILVDVDGVLSGRQIVQVELHDHAIALVHERGTYALALSVFQFDHNLRSARQRQSKDGDKQHGEKRSMDFHSGYYSANGRAKLQPDSKPHVAEQSP